MKMHEPLLKMALNVFYNALKSVISIEHGRESEENRVLYSIIFLATNQINVLQLIHSCMYLK